MLSIRITFCNGELSIDSIRSLHTQQPLQRKGQAAFQQSEDEWKNTDVPAGAGEDACKSDHPVF
jgi:hypothetical protein